MPIGPWWLSLGAPEGAATFPSGAAASRGKERGSLKEPRDLTLRVNEPAPSTPSLHQPSSETERELSLECLENSGKDGTWSREHLESSSRILSIIFTSSGKNCKVCAERGCKILRLERLSLSLESFLARKVLFVVGQ